MGMGRKPKMLKGKMIREAKFPMTLTVKEDDVKNAKRSNPQLCVLARAAMHDRHVVSARIGKEIALIEYKSHYERYKIGSASKKMVKDFDKDGIFVQGSYRLNPIPKSLKLTGKRHSKVKKKRSGPSGKHISSLRPQRNIYRSKDAPSI